MGLRRTDPLDRHRRDCGEEGSSQLNTDAATDGAEDAEDQASIRSEQCGRAKQTGRSTPFPANLSPHALSSQQLLQNQVQQQQRSGKPHDSAQMESSFSSSQIGSLVLNSCSATLPAACSGATGGNGGDRRCGSTPGAAGSGGDGVSPPSLRHLQPPANHSHVNLFVRHLPLELNEEKLRAMFAPFGEIVNSAIMRNIHTGVSLGTAFVRFAKHEEAMRAMEAFAGGRSVTGSKRVTVQWARREHDKAPSGDERRKMRKLFIRNVPKDVTQEMLMALFTQHGSVKSVSTHRDTAAANAVSQPGGGGATAAVEADPSSLSGHDSVAAGSSTDDRRIAFVTFEQEGVAEQATAAVHNTMPFASCQGIPLMVKLAEDTPVRHNALGGNTARANNVGILNGVGANGNGAHAPHNSSGGSVGARHSAIMVGVPNNTLSWSDVPVTDYIVTPMTSPPAAQLHSTTGLTLPPGSGRGMSLRWGGASGSGAGRSFPRVPPDGSAVQVLSPPRFFAGTTGSAGSPNETPPYAGLTPVHSNSAVLPYGGQTSGSAQAPRQPVQSPTPFLAPPKSSSATTATPQHIGVFNTADAVLDGSQTPGSMGLIGGSSGSHPVQAVGSGSPDLMGFAGGDYAGGFPVSSYETQEFYTMLQQCSSNLAAASGATAKSPPSRQLSASVPGAGAAPHSGNGRNHSNSRANAGGLSFHVSGSHTDAVQRDGVTSSSLPQSAQPSSTTPLSNSSFQQSQPKTLVLPQPRSGAVQQAQQQRPVPAESEGGSTLSGGHAPAPYRLIPQPRSNASTSPSVPLSRSAAAAAAAAAAAPSSSASRRANTLPPDACPPSCASTPQKHLPRVLPPSTSASFTAGGGARSRGNGTFTHRVAPEAGAGAVSGASNLRHGPRATSSPMHAIRGGTSVGGGGSSSANSAGAATVTLAAPLNSALAASFASNNTNDFQFYQATRTLGAGSAASCSVHGAIDTRGNSTMKYTAAPPAQPTSLPLPPGRSPAPQSPSRRFSSEPTQPVTAAVAPPTFTTAPLMAAVAKMISTDDAALTPDNTNTFDYGAYTTDDIYAAKSHYSISCATKLMRAVDGVDPPLCGSASGTGSSENVNTNLKKQSATSAFRAQLSSPAPAATASSGAAASTLRRSGQLGDPSPCCSLSLGGAGLLDNNLLFQWESNSAAMNVASGSTDFASIAGAAAPTVLPFSDAQRSNETTGVFDMMSMLSESRTQDLIVLADAPTAGSVSNMRSQPDAGDYWSAAQMRDTEKLGFGAVGGGDMGATVHHGSSTATSTSKELSRRSTGRTLPGTSAQPPSRIGRSDDEDDEQAGWMVYPDIDLNLGWPLGSTTKSKKGGGVVGSGLNSGSSREDADHLGYSQQLGHAMDNLYNLMSYDNASY
ncbi:putative RNA binding protein [Leishmania major strain Friedlin]|uniref:Putative RNA binding protein n=1 Tax=Leishmania major TaxID=5664 RepID=E9ADZ6_LEIMA|nr:putative RNA binding protein [Leishmania major strain Friedlin]CAG9577874.1 RNA_binding_protein_-_putative [Leishmania major strain Friedlin]CBZ12475.1 putative RNA binding protein [Leishmania major strain Friedlin]|eukprot:XP_003722217.1 putative RNA binding protein [Leishmania major strain Friedlin]